MRTKSPTYVETPQSTNVKGWEYDPATRRLIVDFLSGSYAYLDVPPEIVEALRGAQSAGSFLAKNVKPAFKFERAEPPAPVAA